MNTAATRLDLRLNLGDKHRIAQAAALRGIPVSVFVREAVLREANTTIAADVVVTLSKIESFHFQTDLILTPNPLKS